MVASEVQILAWETAEALAALVQSVRHVSGLVEEVSSAIIEQSAGIEQINQAVA